MSATLLSPLRLALCSRENAQRVAARLFDASERPIAVVRTMNPAQPFLVARVGEEAHPVIMEIRS